MILTRRAGFVQPRKAAGGEWPIAGDLLAGIGSFDASTGWTLASWTISGGTLNAGGTSTSCIYGSGLGTIGVSYKVQFDWTHTSGTLYIALGDNEAGPSLTTTASSGFKDLTLEMGASQRIEFFGGSVNGVMDNLRIVPV